MEKTIKMKKKNEEGKLIVKNIPEELSAFYKNTGWDFVKETSLKEEAKESQKTVNLEKFK